MNRYRIGTDEVQVEFVVGPSGLPVLSAVGEPSGLQMVRLRDQGPRILLAQGSRLIELDAAHGQCRVEQDGESALRWRVTLEEGPALQGLWAILGRSARFDLAVRNVGDEAMTVRDVVLLEAQLQDALRGPEIAPGEHALAAPAGGRRDAEPVFIGKVGFVGIDWPAAENAVAGRTVRCRQFPAVKLKPGEQWQSRSCSVGIATAGQTVEQAFLRHLDRARGRPTRRASFYFDWLTHASEGPTAREMELQFDMFERLAKEFGIRFDLYAVDDGAVETRWGLTFSRYRMLHDLLYPQGIKPLADRCKRLGMDFGAWIGPVGFGDSDETAQRRVDELTAMVREWHIGIFKIDTCVGSLMEDDPYVNEWRMSWLARAMDACRTVSPGLVVINHRVSSSPYMLVLLDSTLWESAESYPDVFLNNDDRPRLHTRHAALGRGEPTYYGAYSPLLEDHGVCFNGPLGGWREELVVQTFGRALALSPEVYGNLHQLTDDDLAELGRLMQLAEANRELLAHTKYLAETGDFLHADGTRAMVCLINDSWMAATRRMPLDESLGIARSADTYTARLLFPRERLLGDESDGTCEWGRDLQVRLPPFGVALLQIHPGRPERPYAIGKWFQRKDHAVGTLAVASDAWSVDLGESTRIDEAGAVRDVQDQAMQAIELCRFAICNDPPEWQDLAKLAPSRLEQVNRCRMAFRDKVRREVMAVAANAWDGDERTAWSDFDTLGDQNVWRVDLGAAYPVQRVEIKLADFGVGPLIGRDDAGLDWTVAIEVSDDLNNWTAGRVERYPARQPYRRVRLGHVIAGFADALPARYVRILARGFVCQDITVRARDGQGLRPIQTRNWRGSNMWTMRGPKAVYRTKVTIREAWPGRTLAVVAELPGSANFAHRQEHSFAWIDTAGKIQPFVEASPRPAFHGWEHSPGAPVRAVTWRMPVSRPIVGTPLAVCFAWIGPEQIDEAHREVLPRVAAWLVADGIPFVPGTR